jgi:hypothetical protein
LTETKWKEFRKIIDGKLERGSLAYEAYQSENQYLMHFSNELIFQKEVEHIERLSEKDYAPDIDKIDIENMKIYLPHYAWYNNLNHLIHEGRAPDNWREQVSKIIEDLERGNIYKLNLFTHCFYLEEGKMHLMDLYGCVFPDQIVMFDHINPILSKRSRDLFLQFKELNGIVDMKEAYRYSKINNVWGLNEDS